MIVTIYNDDQRLIKEAVESKASTATESVIAEASTSIVLMVEYIVLHMWIICTLRTIAKLMVELYSVLRYDYGGFWFE